MAEPVLLHLRVPLHSVLDLVRHLCTVLCYFQLCSEDYNWWWRAYLTAGSSSFYSIFYFFTKLVSGMLYLGYMIIISYAFFVLTGTIGFF
ncbi:hypothetical protein BRARA_A03234 [Brassica rapa]|uniref:Transmembrane 9 superfamily member n=1 Tax=Brassica campestris TaxID=3711 RepID=A0A398AYJ2_BRACM|nr:hypothetical protein BRARA_A03234 [Brassica rapa]